MRELGGEGFSPNFSFNPTKSHTIDIHLEAVTPHLIAVPLIGLIVIDELPMAIRTDIILFPFSMFIVADVGELQSGHCMVYSLDIIF